MFLNTTLFAQKSNYDLITKELTQEQRALRSRFQTVHPETPPPGTYVNIFA